MTKQRLLLLLAGAAMAIAAITIALVLSLSGKAADVDAEAPPESLPDAEIVEEEHEGEDTHWREDLTFEQMCEHDPDSCAILGEVPTKTLNRALNLATAWATFDSRDDDQTRAKQLAPFIQNPEDWGGWVNALYYPLPYYNTFSSFHTESKLTADPTLMLSWTFELDGRYSVGVDIPFRTESYITAGTERVGTVDATRTWVFTFDDAGNLVDVIEPILDVQS